MVRSPEVAPTHQGALGKPTSRLAIKHGNNVRYVPLADLRPPFEHAWFTPFGGRASDKATWVLG